MMTLIYQEATAGCVRDDITLLRRYCRMVQHDIASLRRNCWERY